MCLCMLESQAVFHSAAICFFLSFPLRPVTIPMVVLLIWVSLLFRYHCQRFLLLSFNRRMHSEFWWSHFGMCVHTWLENIQGGHWGCIGVFARYDIEIPVLQRRTGGVTSRWF